MEGAHAYYIVCPKNLYMPQNISMFMESRKVYVSGGSTYVMSLPKKWVRKTNLKPGDSLVVSEQGDSLLVGAGAPEREPWVKDIRISQVESTEALERMLVAYYLAGYDTLRIRLDRKDHLAYREGIRKMPDRLIGVEIVEDTDSAMTLEIMLDYKRVNAGQALQRMFFINKSMLLDFGRALKGRDAGLARDIVAREHEVDRLYFLVVRQLKSAVKYQQTAETLGIASQRDCLGYRIIVKVLERIADHIENMATSCMQMSGMGNDVRLDKFLLLAGDIAVTFEKSMLALFARNHEAAGAVFDELKDIEGRHAAISRELFSIEDIQSAILMKTMLDSLGRIADYSGDIAEVAINMSIEDS